MTFILSLILGLVFLYHGYQKLSLWRSGTGPGFLSVPLLRILSVSETLGGIALIIHFLLPFAVIGLSIIMLGAIYYKVVKWKLGWFAPNGAEYDIVLLFALLSLL